MVNRIIFSLIILVCTTTHVRAEQSAEQLLENFRVLIEKVFYKKCKASKTLSDVKGFCNCYSVRSADSFTESDLVYYAKTKKFSDAFMAKTKDNARKCLKQIRNQ